MHYNCSKGEFQGVWGDSVKRNVGTQGAGKAGMCMNTPRERQRDFFPRVSFKNYDIKF